MDEHTTSKPARPQRRAHPVRRRRDRSEPPRAAHHVPADPIVSPIEHAEAQMERGGGSSGRGPGDDDGDDRRRPEPEDDDAKRLLIALCIVAAGAVVMSARLLARGGRASRPRGPFFTRRIA